MVTPEPIFIFGAGEVARLAKYYLEQDSNCRVAAFVVDDDQFDQNQLLGVPVLKLSDAYDKFPSGRFRAHVALSYRGLNRNRERAFSLLKSQGYSLVSYVCSRSVTWPDLVHGENCFILENQTIQPTVTLGHNVMLWSGNHIGHGATIADHTYLASHVVISGHTRIGQRCFLGVNAATKDFVNIGNDVFVGMGANVTTDLSDGSVAIGARGTVLDAHDPLAIRLKQKYFGLVA